MNKDSLADRLNDLLLRQARERNAPEWVMSLLEQREDVRDYSETGDSTLRVRRGDQELEIVVHLVPPPPTRTRAGPGAPRAPWVPADLTLTEADLARLSYIVIDEIVGDAVDISVSRWPDLDERGRLRFRADERPRTVRASARALEKYLSRIELRPTKLARPLRMGDTFAARVRERKLDALDSEGRAAPVTPGTWLIPPISDITEQARDKAKEAFYAAVTPTLRPQEARAMEKVEIRRPPRR
jgi:hypothetical protein